MSEANIRAWLALINALKATLCEAAKERSARPEFVPGPDGWLECEWVRYERQQMHATVNEHRSERGLPPVSLEAVRRVERGAEGHSDYVAKFAIGCAELVVGRRSADHGALVSAHP